MKDQIMKVLPKSMSNREKKAIATEVISTITQRFAETGRLVIRGLGTLSRNDGMQEFTLDNKTESHRYVKGTLKLSRSFKSYIKENTDD